MFADNMPYPNATPSRKAIAGLKASYDATRSNHFIVLVGATCGTGKTWDACGIALNVCAPRIDKNTGCLPYRGFIRFVDCCMIQQYDAERMESCHRAKALILDDYGARLTDGAKLRVFELVNKRMHDGNKVTIITTNLIAEVSAADPRLASRLNKACVIDYEGLTDKRKEET